VRFTALGSARRSSWPPGRPVGEIAAAAVLVRPDGHVAWASSQTVPDADELRGTAWRAYTLVRYLIARHPTRSTHCARDGPGSNASVKYCVSWVTSPPSNSMMLTT
jgi:hypothetical protein